MRLVIALLHAHFVRFEIVLQVASATAPGELGAIVGRLIEVVPILDALAAAWVRWAGAFWYLGGGRDGRCRVRKCENTDGGNCDGNDWRSAMT